MTENIHTQDWSFLVCQKMHQCVKMVLFIGWSVLLGSGSDHNDF